MPCLSALFTKYFCFYRNVALEHLKIIVILSLKNGDFLERKEIFIETTIPKYKSSNTWLAMRSTVLSDYSNYL